MNESTQAAENGDRPMTPEERQKWRIREDQCPWLLTTRLPLDTACLLPRPCADHPSGGDDRG